MTAKEQEIKTFKSQEVAKICDHTFLKRVEAYKDQAAPGDQLLELREKDFYRFLDQTINPPLKPYAVCIRSEDVPHAFRYLENHSTYKIPIVATVGFPEGFWYQSNYKIFEAQYALGEGADEIDVVMNYRALQQGDYSFVHREVSALTKIAHSQGCKIKLILEVSELTKPQLVQACQIASHTGVDFIKTSSGFSGAGVLPEQLQIIFEYFKKGIKISGGITRYNIHTYLSWVNNIWKQSFQLDPEKFRIGESQLLEDLAAPCAK